MREIATLSTGDSRGLTRESYLKFVILCSKEIALSISKVPVANVLERFAWELSNRKTKQFLAIAEFSYSSKVFLNTYRQFLYMYNEGNIVAMTQRIRIYNQEIYTKTDER